MKKQAYSMIGSFGLKKVEKKSKEQKKNWKMCKK